MSKLTRELMVLDLYKEEVAILFELIAEKTLHTVLVGSHIHSLQLIVAIRMKK